MTLWLQSQFNLDMCNHCNVENIESIAINAILIFACAMESIYNCTYNSTILHNNQTISIFTCGMS